MGPCFLNFFCQISDYANEIEIMQNLTKEEYLASLRRCSTCLLMIDDHLTFAIDSLSREKLVKTFISFFDTGEAVALQEEYLNIEGLQGNNKSHLSNLLPLFSSFIA